MHTRTFETVDTVVVGAGHAGLAVSRLLTQARREHVVLERGQVGQRWRSERWDSLHLLTPNWMTRLPGWYYAGPDPDGYLPAAGFVRNLERYAASFTAPVLDRTTVGRLTRAPGDRFDVHTDRGTWRCRDVVVATGPHARPAVPDVLRRADIPVVPSSAYRNPEALPAGAVLVVGASSSGVQIADELSRAGREVVLAVGRHTRMPRRYRGMDIFWWLDVTGRLGRTIDEVPDRDAARREPSLQLVGRGDPQRRHESLDLGALQRQGVRLAGRLVGLRGRVVELDGGLADRVAEADSRMHRFLDAADRHVERAGLVHEVLPPYRPAPIALADAPDRLDLAAAGVGSVVVATGFHPDHGWLEVPVTGPDGTVRQHRGVTAVPGLYVVGQRFQHRRDSGFIDGARHDAHAVVAHLLARHPSRTPAAAAVTTDPTLDEETAA